MMIVSAKNGTSNAPVTNSDLLSDLKPEPFLGRTIFSDAVSLAGTRAAAPADCLLYLTGGVNLSGMALFLSELIMIK